MGATTERDSDFITLEAGADLSAKQFRFVEVASDGQVDAVSSAGGNAIGVLMNKPDAAGKPAKIQTHGITKVVAGGSVTRGGKVQSDAAGDAIDATTGDHVLGQALDAGDDGDVIRVLLVSKHILA